MNRIFLILFSITIALSACNEEKIIGDISISQKFLIAVESNTPRLILYDNNKGIISNDIYFEKNGKVLPAKISKMKEYGGMLFLLMPSVYKIEIISKQTFVSLKTIDFSDTKREPTDICFANVTDAYISHGNDSVLTLLDIYNLVPARIIPVGRHPVSIACAGNQIVVANQLDNTISIVDSRTHKQEKVIAVGKVPSLVDVNGDSTKAVVVSLGEGKINETQQKSSAKVTFIDIYSRKITSSVELTAKKTNATDQFPVCLVVTKSNKAFIQTKTNLIRLDVKKESGINTLTSIYNKSVLYYKLRNQLIFCDAEGREVKITNTSNAGKIFSFTLTDIISFVYPI